MAPTSKYKGRDAARSRNSTPMSISTEPSSSKAPVAVGSMTYAEILELCRGSSTPNSAILQRIKEGLQYRSEVAKNRTDVHDKGMRESSRRKKEENERQRELEMARREEAERLEKSKQSRKEQQDRPLAVGAHSVARQDGRTAADKTVAVEDPDVMDEGDQVEPKSATVEESASDSDSDSDSHQPRPAPAIPQYQTFGADPSTFDDPTIYHIRDIDEDMDIEMKREILGVASFPRDDLYDQTCGTAPDRDLTNAKPAHQYTAQQFATWLEPFFRPYTEEDKQFLLERGDRTGPMLIPPRGAKGYKEVWADEDNVSYGDGISNTPSAPSTTIHGNGSIEQMSDEVAESGEVSTGPMLARLLQCLIPEGRTGPGETNNHATTNGDTTMTNGIDGDDAANDTTQTESLRNHPPATRLPDAAMPPPSSTNASGAKSTTGPSSGPGAASTSSPAPTSASTSNAPNGTANKPNWTELDERVKLELRYLGFLPEDAAPDYEGHHDDEIAARLRWLQEELQRVSTTNGARKAKVLEMVEDDMARQEWLSISDDLDSQLNQAYLKRHRNSSKGRGKLKRAGAASNLSGAGAVNGVPGSSAAAAAGAAGLGVGRPVMGEQIKELMRRRSEWRDYLGPVVDFGRRGVPDNSCFEESVMEELVGREREGWSEAQDGS